MDKSVGAVFGSLPPDALVMTTTRPLIRMRHGPTWTVDKINDDHDLVVCATGSASYRVEGIEDEITLRPGEAMLIPSKRRFVGRFAGNALYTGLAQHFQLRLFGELDLIDSLALKPKVRFARWEHFEPLVDLIRVDGSPAAITLLQHHLLTSLILEYLDEAAQGWREGALIGSQSALTLHVVVTAARISSRPADPEVVEEALAKVPLNQDYFRRAFRRYLGRTPQKFFEQKRMEAAMNQMAIGRTVKETAHRLGFEDVYYFSRVFKKATGVSPAHYRACRLAEAGADD